MVIPPPMWQQQQQQQQQQSPFLSLPSTGTTGSTVATTVTSSEKLETISDYTDGNHYDEATPKSTTITTITGMNIRRRHRGTPNSSNIHSVKTTTTPIDPWLYGTSSSQFASSRLSSSISTSSSTVAPVVGILAQPYYHNVTNDNGQRQYIAASYVKWIEAAGGRSIPIPYDTTSHELLDELFLQINGLFLPGGGNSTIPYAVRYLLDLSSRSNPDNYFPVWGTCLGFEMLLQYVGNRNPSGNTSNNETNVLQSDFNATNVSLPLLLVNNDDSTISMESVLYAPPHIRDSVTQYAITMNNHHQGIEPQQFQNNPYLTSVFHISSMNYDLNGRPFVSTMEPNDPLRHPFYGIQYHPEKNAFEYATYPNTTIPYESIDHSALGIEFSLYVAEFFMNCVRYSQQYNTVHQYTNVIKFPTTIMYPIITGGLSFEESYILPNASHWENVDE